MKTRLLALLLCVTLLSGCGGSPGTGTPEEDGYDGLVFSTVDRGVSGAEILYDVPQFDQNRQLLDMV